jgi:hypothetical protein
VTLAIETSGDVALAESPIDAGEAYSAPEIGVIKDTLGFRSCVTVIATGLDIVGTPRLSVATAVTV